MSKTASSDVYEFKPNQLLQALYSIYRNNLIMNDGEPQGFVMGTAPFIWGRTGIGKSSIIQQLVSLMAGCGQFSQPITLRNGCMVFDPKHDLIGNTGYSKDAWGLVDLRIPLLEPSDLRGIPFPEDGKTAWLPPEDLPILSQRDKFPEYGILLLDELPNASPALQNACYQLVLDRKVGVHQLKPGWLVVAAGNLSSEAANTYELSHPLKNRFNHYQLGCDVESFKEWAYAQKGFNPVITSFLSSYPDFLHSDPKEEEASPAFPTPRSWSTVNNLLKVLPELDVTKDEDMNMLNSHVGASIGVTSTYFTAFYRIFEEFENGPYADLAKIIDGTKKPKPFPRTTNVKNAQGITTEQDTVWAFTARVIGYLQQTKEKDMTDTLAKLYSLLTGDLTMKDGKPSINYSLYQHYPELARSLQSEIKVYILNAPHLPGDINERKNKYLIPAVKKQHPTSGLDILTTLAKFWEFYKLS